MTKLKLLSAALIAAASLATPAMARTSHETSRHHARAPIRAPLTAASAFQRRASAHFLRRPRTGKIATSVITRVYAEKAAQRNGSVRLCDAQLWGAMCGDCLEIPRRCKRL